MRPGEPPDFEFGTTTSPCPRWAGEGRLVELSAPWAARRADRQGRPRLGHAAGGRTGRQGLYACPWLATHHVHVWRSLLERAGFQLADIPKEWEPFWSFWCDRVQPAVRKASGGDDVWGVGVTMSAEASDTMPGLGQFADAYTATGQPWGPSLADDPAAQATLVEGLAGYTAIYKKGCTPPDRRLDQSRQQRRLPRPERRDDDQHRGSRSRTRSGESGRRTTPERGDHRLAERRLRGAAAPRGQPNGRRYSGRRAHARRRWSSCGSWSGTAGSRSGRASRATATCRCRSCSTSRSGSTRATRTG